MYTEFLGNENEITVYICCSIFDLIQPYFCGQDDDCMDYKSEWALQKAKTVIEMNYPLVGLSERTEETLLLMEAVFPQFYKGLPDYVATLRSSGER